MKRAAWIAIAAVSCVSSVGCTSGGEKLAPVGGADGGADGELAATPAVSVKRTVMMRNPFGGPAGNLLVDGDFELSTVASPGAQVGWRAFATDGTTEVGLATETGGLCRSGLRCAVMAPGTVVFIRGTSARGKGNVASFWAKLSKGTTCSAMRPILVGCDDGFTERPLAHPTVPDADGWCHYTATLSEQGSATCLFVESTLTGGATALLDAAVIGPDDGTVTPLAAEVWAPEAHTLVTLANVQARLRQTMPVGRPDPRPLR